jgi:hypothetical protein
MGGTNVTYKPLDPQQVGEDTLQTQLGLAGGQFAAESLYRPLYANLEQSGLRQTLFGGEQLQKDPFAVDPGLETAYQTWRENMLANGGENPDLSRQTFLGEHFREHPNSPLLEYLSGGAQPGLLDTLGEAGTQFQNIQQGLNTAQRTADIADVANLGPAADAARRAANPQLSAVLDSLVERTGGTSLSNGVSPITNTLEQQALGGLQLGGQLSDAQRRLVEQSSRAAFGSRGLGRSQSAAVDEALRNLDASRAIERERQQFASGVAGLGQAERTQNVAQQGQTAQLLGGLAQDPFMAILGRPSGAGAAGAGLLGQGSAFNANAGPTMFNPFDPAVLGIYSGNQENKFAADAASGNNNAALLGSAAMAAAMLFCWTAREAYGADNPRWLRVRHWVLTQAPARFRTLYGRYGARLAERMRGDGALKARVTGLLDTLVPEAAAPMGRGEEVRGKWEEGRGKGQAVSGQLAWEGGA